MPYQIINGVHVDGVLANQIPRIRKQVIKHDSDKVIIIDGKEGCGKSVFGMQLAKALDNDFNIDKMAFDSAEFENLIRNPNRKKGDCILLDEAFTSANTRATMSGINKAMVAIGTQMRQLNLFVIIILPTFFDLDKYYSIWRSEILIHCYKNKKGQRGNYIIFPFKKKMKLYLKGKKMYNYGCVKSPYPACCFRKEYVIDEQEYRKRKRGAFTSPTHGNRDKLSKIKYQVILIRILNYVKKEYKLTNNKIAEITNSEPKLIRKLGETAMIEAIEGNFAKENGLISTYPANIINNNLT